MLIESGGRSNFKRLVVFLDGTWNVVSDNTNIWRMRSLCSPKCSQGIEQRVYYSTGLGTQVGEKVRGGMFGRGIDTAITAAYEWLTDNFEPNDEIFIFGFSRGAYTARSLSGFILKSGLLMRGAPLGVNQLFMRYRTKGARTIRQLLAADADAKKSFSKEEHWVTAYSQAVPIKFLGVYDTVGALGVPFPIWRRLRGQAYPFLNTGLRQPNEFAFHALAIDEHRYAFRPTLWSNQGATDVSMRPVERTEQRWFIGAHANVGGGYYTDPLCQLPLKWIEGKAMSLGLSFDARFSLTQDAGAAPITDSFAPFMKGLYRISRLGLRHYRPIGVPPAGEGPGVVSINETIDSSVFERWRADKSYRPPALKKWAKKHSLDPASLNNTVRADNPRVVV